MKRQWKPYFIRAQLRARCNIKPCCADGPTFTAIDFPRGQHSGIGITSNELRRFAGRARWHTSTQLRCSSPKISVVVGRHQIAFGGE